MHFKGSVSITLEFSFHGAWRVRSYQEQHSGIAAWDHVGFPLCITWNIFLLFSSSFLKEKKIKNEKMKIQSQLNSFP